MNRVARLLPLTLIAIALALLPASAGAATQVGQACPISSSTGPVAFQLSTSSGEPYVVSRSGILTSWGVNASAWGNNLLVAAVFGTFAGGQWTVARETPFQRVLANTSPTFNTRIPVAAGETIGLSGNTGASFVCGGFDPTGDVLNYAISPVLPGASFSPSTAPSFRTAVWGVVEDDVDGDGYGDDSQDKCPQSAAFQNPCPVLSISQQLSASKTQINVLAASSIDAQLVAVAVVSIPKIGKKKARRVTIQGTGVQFAAGQLKRLTLKLPSSVKSALKKKGRVGATVTLSGSGLANTATVTGKVSIRQK